MARYSFRRPDIGEGIAEAEIVAWHVKVGERVEEDAQLADMMTDKATVEMESPVSGVVVELAGGRARSKRRPPTRRSRKKSSRKRRVPRKRRLPKSLRRFPLRRLRRLLH